MSAVKVVAPAHRRRRGEAGVATVEAVLVVPLVLVPVLAAVVILGHLAHTRIVLDAAAAAGARQAAVIGADGPSVRSRITAELSDGGLDPGTVLVTVTPASAAWGEPIRVRLT
ncbi:MAG: TadE/TadG family type IV pilus assembly protein, partial [Chloroflexota bacterium]|nr:TadE/TadG family type IV pilus assembly protein [Chloroflexota bacterium]